MTLPNFFLIGATKSGTTSLYHYLKDHPQIYMSPVKEPEHFSFMGRRIDPGDYRKMPGNLAVTDSKAYEALFRGVTGESAVGEASSSYLYVPETAPRIQERIRDPKFIAILRDPAERAHSHFNMLKNRQNSGILETSADLKEALAAEPERMERGWACAWHYKARGFYHAQVKRWYDRFGRDRVRVFLYEDLCSDPIGVAKEIFRFLGVDDSFTPEVGEIHNRGIYTTRMDPSLRGKLVSDYRGDILRLQELIGRDLSSWLHGPS